MYRNYKAFCFIFYGSIVLGLITYTMTGGVSELTGAVIGLPAIVFRPPPNWVWIGLGVIVVLTTITGYFIRRWDINNPDKSSDIIPGSGTHSR